MKRVVRINCGGRLLPKVSDEDLRRFRNEYRSAVPNANPLCQDWVVAAEVARTILGAEWAQRWLHDPDPYFLTVAADGTLDSWRRTQRFLEFVRHLYDLQHLGSFADLVKDLRTMDLVGASKELHIAHRLTANGHLVRFIPRTGTRGHDFDQVVTLQGIDIFVEVKTKDEANPYSRGSLDRSLRLARKQLPSSGPGLIFLQIPTAWTADPDFVTEIGPLLIYHLRNSSRVNGIVLLWEQWTALPSGGMAYTYHFQLWENSTPRVAVPGLAALIQPL